MKDCMTIDSVFMRMSSLRALMLSSFAECFPATLRWYLIEQVWQGDKVWSALAFHRAGYCAIIYKHLPLLLHACVQSAHLCASPPAFARVYEATAGWYHFWFISLQTSISTFLHNQKICSEHFLKCSLHLYNGLTNVPRIFFITVPHFQETIFHPDIP